MKTERKDIAAAFAVGIAALLRPSSPIEDAAMFATIGFAVIGLCGSVYHLWRLFA